MAARAEYTTCYTLLHAWERHASMGAPEWPDCTGGVLGLRCVRCGTERYDGLDQWGEVVRRKYEWPDGYRMTADEKPTRQELRLVIIKRRP
jgi:hypothetical protein